MEEGEHWRLAGEKELGQGGTINSFFLQPRGRDSQLEIPRGPPALPFGGLQGVMFIQVPPQGSYPEAHLGSFSCDVTLALKPAFLGQLLCALCRS